MADIQHLTPKKNGWQAVFLSAIRNTGNVRAACQQADISRCVAYDKRHKSPTFAKAWDEALQDAVDVLEAAAWKRAAGSPDAPPSDTLLIFLLKCHRRAVYGDKQQLEVTGKDGAPMEYKIRFDGTSDS